MSPEILSPALTFGTPANLRSSAAKITALVIAHGLATSARANVDDIRAAANDAPTELPKVHVEETKVKPLSSPKFTQPLRDIPQTVVVIPSTVYAEQGATSLRDVLRNTPGITFQAGEGGNAPGDNLFIRGFGARNDVFIDGVRDAGVLTRDTFNIEQVEVSKGPSSATSGRGSTGGSVNQVSKAPHRGDSTVAQVTFGSENYGRATLDTNQEFANTKGAAVRLNAVWTDGGVVGRNEVKNSNWGIAPSVALGLGSPTTATLSYAHMSQDNLPDYGLPGTLPAGAIAAGKTINDLNWANFYGLVTRDYEKIESDSVTAVIEHKFDGETSLRNLTRYGRNARDAVVTPPRAVSIPPTVPSATNGMLDAGYDPTQAQVRRTDTKYQDRQDEIVANQANLTARFNMGEVAHALVAGLEVSRESQESYAKVDDNIAVTAADASRPPVTDLYNPNPHDAYTPAIHHTGALTKAIADSGAVYVFDTLKFGKKWEVTGGARYEIFDVAYKSITAPTPTVAATTARFQRTDDMLSWRGGVVFKPLPTGSVYAGYGRAYNPSAEAAQGLSLAGSGVTSAALEPEKSDSYEIGTKWDLVGRRLALTGAVFRTEKVNARTTDASGNTVLAGNQQVDGFELGASGKLTDNWFVFGGYAWMNAEVNASGVPQQVDAQLTYVPKQSFNLWTTYRLPFGLTLGGGSQFTDGYYYALPTAAATATVTPQTKYWLHSAMASYELNKNLTLRLNINNLADTRYVDRGYAAHFIPGPGRTLLLSAAYKF
ncbi:MAG: bfrD [Verrucomicrobia bacterium]|nr:bfrD [Verrucomicrobiota bacterium]